MKFKGKPVIIEAQQFFVRRMPWPSGVVAGPGPRTYMVTTREGVQPIVEGDWLITDAAGDKHICPPGIFNATYREVS